jgi:hypothetical protein
LSQSDGLGLNGNAEMRSNLAWLLATARGESAAFEYNAVSGDASAYGRRDESWVRLLDTEPLEWEADAFAVDIEGSRALSVIEQLLC